MAVLLNVSYGWERDRERERGKKIAQMVEWFFCFLELVMLMLKLEGDIRRCSWHEGCDCFCMKW